MSDRAHKRRRGQGLVEFAMVLPLMLFTMAGLAEFGRIFAVYSGMFNAAREGTRFGIVDPLDVTGIRTATESKIFMVDPSEVAITVTFDSGPGTATKDVSNVQVGDRVVVRVYYDVEPMLPFLEPLMRSLYVETVAARTIMSMGDGSMAPPPTAIPTPTVEGTPENTPTPTVENTPTPTVETTPTPTPENTSTPTVTPTPDIPIQITEPLHEGDMVVRGSAEPNQLVSLRDIQNPSLSVEVRVDPDGWFTFNLDQALVAGHVIVVQGYDKTDWAIVQSASTPTPTASPTPSPTPTLTPTPGNMDIMLVPSCGPLGSNTITVYGYNWPNNDVKIMHVFGDTEIEVGYVREQDFDTNFAVEVTIEASQQGTHEIKAYYKSDSNWVPGDWEPYTVPCAAPPTPTPTPTPAYPNLVVERLALVNTPPISTHDPLTFTVAVHNAGETAANNLFWVDLYVDPTQVLSPTNPLVEESDTWAAVSSLEPGASITLTLYYHAGLDAVGAYEAYAMADTWNQVVESDELDNLSDALDVTIEVTGTLPTPTPTTTPAPVEDGAISGSTWLYINGDLVLQGRVNVYCYDGDVLIGETLSEQDGSYLLEGVPPGTYTVVGEATINDVLYSDLVTDITVNSGETTPYVTLILH